MHFSPAVAIWHSIMKICIYKIDNWLTTKCVFVMSSIVRSLQKGLQGLQVFIFLASLPKQAPMRVITFHPDKYITTVESVEICKWSRCSAHGMCTFNYLIVYYLSIRLIFPDTNAANVKSNWIYWKMLLSYTLATLHWKTVTKHWREMLFKKNNN